MTDAELDLLVQTAPAWARAMFALLGKQIGEIMAGVKVQQEDLDALSAKLGSIADDLETELAALNVPAGDLSGVQAVVDRLRNDVTVPATPTA